jgi:hypothetical protein
MPSFYIHRRKWIANMNLAASYYTLGKVWGEELPKIALAALEQGLDSKSLRILAGEAKTTISETGPLFEKARSELHIQLPDFQEAAYTIVYYRVQQILTSELGPLEGAALLWEEIHYSLDDELVMQIVERGLRCEDLSRDEVVKYYGEKLPLIVKPLEIEILDLAQKLSKELHP